MLIFDYELVAPIFSMFFKAKYKSMEIATSFFKIKRYPNSQKRTIAFGNNFVGYYYSKSNL
jgi:hypothetical protein